MNEFKVLHLSEQNSYNERQIIQLQNLEFKPNVGIHSDFNPNTSNCMAVGELFTRDSFLWVRVLNMEPFNPLLKSGFRFWFAPEGKVIERHEKIIDGEHWEIITSASIDHLILFSAKEGGYPDDKIPCILDQIAEHVEGILLSESLTNI